MMSNNLLNWMFFGCNTYIFLYGQLILGNKFVWIVQKFLNISLFTLIQEFKL